MPVTFHKKNIVKLVKKKIVMGFDVSTKTGVVALSPSVLYSEDVVSPPSEGSVVLRMHRLAEFNSRVVELLNLYDPDVVVLEGYGYANPYTLATLVEFGTVLRAAVFKRKNTTMAEVSPAQLKKFVLGKGVGKKDQMRLGVYKKWGFEHTSDNVVDAYGLARIGLCIAGVMAPTDKIEKEVLTVIPRGKPS